MRNPSHETASVRRFLTPAILLRGIASLTVFGAAVVGFSSGVGVSERDLSGMGFLEHAYYALGLFVLGGLDIGTPVGGSTLGRNVLWVAYFAAPTITVFAILEAVLRLIRPLGSRLRPPSDHLVVAGAGRLTAQFVRRLRQGDPDRTILVVERASEGPYHAELTRRHRATIVQGDISNDRLLDELRLPFAHRVMLLTNDDFANLDAAAKIVRRAPGLAGRIVTHVSDLRFMQETSESSVARDCEIFNGHEFAARHLVEGQLVQRFNETPGQDPIVIAGFGRFGRTVLAQLQRSAPGSFGPVIIVDHDATRNARLFHDGPGFDDGYEHLVLDGDLLDPVVWDQVHASLADSAAAPVFILGSGADGTNLQAGLSLRKRHPNAYVVVRGFRASPFTEEVAQEAGLHSVHLGRLIRDGMPERWF